MKIIENTLGMVMFSEDTMLADKKRAVLQCTINKVLGIPTTNVQRARPRGAYHVLKNVVETAKFLLIFQ